MWAFIGVTVALIGLAPKRSGLAWGASAACGVLCQLGPIFQLPEEALRISPFANVPRLPGADLEVRPMAVLVIIAGVLTALGVKGFRRRDIG